VKILSKTEESTTTLWAYIFTTKNKDSFLSANRILMLDHGGGTTELSFFEKQKLVFTHSFDIGSTILKNNFFKQSTNSIRNALNETDTFALNFINIELQEHVDYAQGNIEYSVGVGRALTIATGEKSNEKQHDFKLTKNKITQVINSLGDEICDYKTMENLKKNAKNDWVENKIVTRLGLPIILEIMNHFQIDSLYVNGTGLWYGVFFKEFHNIN
jgi:exopolyphosphatase/pppGpp-phosphohydrolase